MEEEETREGELDKEATINKLTHHRVAESAAGPGSG